nr:putative atp-dependent helicase c17a2.12 [Quercus suber]
MLPSFPDGRGMIGGVYAVQNCEIGMMSLSRCGLNWSLLWTDFFRFPGLVYLPVALVESDAVERLFKETPRTVVRMAILPASRKRKAASANTGIDKALNAKKQRTGLQLANASQAHNKGLRRRVLAFVAIPKVKVEVTSAATERCSDLSDCKAVPTPTQDTPHARIGKDFREKVEPAAIPASTRSSPEIGHEVIAASRRPSRRVSRPSYVDVSVESDDDDSLPNRSRNKEPDDEDFIFGASDRESAHESEDEALLDVDESDEGSFSAGSEEYISDVDQPERRSIGYAKAKPASVAVAKSAGSQKQMVRSLNHPNKNIKGLDASTPPLHKIDEIFSDLTQKALDRGFDKCLRHLNGRPLRVATMCSGTESPLLALEMVRDSIKALGTDVPNLRVQHVFSAEIEPYKQAYIDRNFAPPVIFRDITEFVDAVQADVPVAFTNYGGKYEIPGDVHILIAGTSCVDYSKLNNKQKGIADGGESGKTWLGAKAYCERFRPAIVIFENVSGADWDQMLVNYRALDYECRGILVDTKHYYLPQTRQRGYMVCFDKTHTSKTNFIGDRWIGLMQEFKRPTSSPVSSYLLPSDQIVIRQQAHEDDAVRDFDWTACELTQMDYRFTMGLGIARPFTHWQESGTMLPPENGNAQWFRSQVERVKDTIDCLYLRKALPARGGYDARFKTRLVDLSQNVYRNEDATSFGLIGCITPSGICFVSDACRVLTAEETLVLQGLPLSKISFTTETAIQVQDMAGNAMSTTVVGSAILSALICGYSVIQPKQDSAPKPVAVTNTTIHERPMANVSIKSVQSLQDLDAQALFDLARRSIRRCYCEGSHAIADKPIQQCRECKHTTCTACGGNPKHVYDATDSIHSRLHPDEFLSKFKGALPLTIEFQGLEDFQPLQNANEEYVAAIKAATSSVFNFLAIRGTYGWTIEYVAPHARLELLIEQDHAEWRLYALPDPTLPSSAWLRNALLQAVAVCELTNVSFLFDGKWLCRTACDRICRATITPLDARNPSWWARNGMFDFRDHKQYDRLEVQIPADDEGSFETPISGVYRHLPDCGKACNSLYKRVMSDSERPVYLFLDPTRTGDETADEFVFSFNKDQMEYEEVRRTIARVDAQWRPWDPLDRVRAKQGIDKGTSVRISTDAYCMPLPVTLRPRRAELHIRLPTQEDSRLSPCNEATLMLDCEWTNPSDITASDRGEHLLGKTDDSHFLTTYTWLFEAIRRQLPDEAWKPLDAATCSRCDATCTPSKPALRWKMSSHGNTIKPYEDPIMAAAYERQIKARPDPIVLSTEVRADKISVKFGINFGTLAHRAMARLPQDVEATLKWKLYTDGHALLSQSLPKFKLADTEDATCPGIDITLGNKTTLFPKQRTALAWMRAQEKGVSWMLEEAEEAGIRQLGWHVELRAQTLMYARGGVCADHPGFGKTVTSLALIQSELNEKDRDAILAGMQSGPDTSGLIPTAATLIICPTPLVQQWVDEIQDKLDLRGSSVMWIMKLSDLSTKTIEQFSEAKIIVLNKAVLDSGGKYVEKIANFIGAPGPAAVKDRALSQWLQFANSEIPKSLKILMKDGVKVFRQHVEQNYKDNLRSEQFKAMVPSRRLRGKEAGKESATKPVTTKGASATIDTKEIDRPFFEMFHFNRIIVDEFHDYEPREYAAVVGLYADKRWGLSGTPSMGDCYDISKIAELLKIPLRTGSSARGIMKRKNAERLDKELTSFEQFEMMRSTPSQALQSRIHEQAQEFLDTFVRRNIMDGTALQYADHLVPVVLDTDHRALNFELLQHLNSLDMRIKRGKKKGTTDREDLVHKMVNQSNTAEEALVKTAAFFGRDINTRDAASGLTYFANTRQQEVSGLLSELRRAIKTAHTSERAAFDRWSSTLRINLGDREVVADIESILNELKIKFPDSGLKKTEAGGKKDTTTQANALVKRLKSAKRSHRYLLAVQDLMHSAAASSTACSVSDCHASVNTDLAVSALCGHVICTECWQHVNIVHQCPAIGCSSTVNKWNLLWKSQLGNAHDSTPYGAKIEAAMKILDEIRAKGDQAILFVQFENQVHEVEEALRSRSIPGVVVKSPTTAGMQIKAFRENSKDAVIVLNASDQTAAGSNLQNANHVIVLGPLLRNDQYEYESTMAQMIGRVRRHGQKKPIHVYRIVALNTIDVDILEQRERRAEALDERGSHGSLSPLGELGAEQPKMERTQLIRTENESYSLRPRSWLVRGRGREGGSVGEGELVERTQGRARVSGYEDFSSLIKFSKAFTEYGDE